MVRNKSTIDEEDLAFTKLDKDAKRLEKENLLQNILISLAVLHQGTDFFERHNILNKVKATSLSKARYFLSEAAGSVIIRKEDIPFKAFNILTVFLNFSCNT